MTTIRIDLVISRAPSSDYWRVTAGDIDNGSLYATGHPTSLHKALENIGALVRTQYPDDPNLVIISGSITDV